MHNSELSFYTDQFYVSYSFIALHTVIHPRAVTEFIYRYSSSEVAHVYLSFQLEGKLPRTAEVANVLTTLESEGMKGVDISDDELAKTHGRYMIGGKCEVPNERVFRFGKCSRSTLSIDTDFTVASEFPERPNALRNFLIGLHKGWNISLFHYRNHGAGGFC
jgi:threonine dehydratase